MNPVVKKWLHWSGGSVGLAGVIFIAIRLHQYSEQLDFIRFGPKTWLTIIALALVYGCANYLLAAAWFYILNFLQIRVCRNWAVKTYGISQLAKYIPGNIFQFAGRQALGLAADLPGLALAKSVFWELALLSMAGALFICPAVFSVLTGLRSWDGMLIFLIIIIAAGLCMSRLMGSYAVKAFICHLLFLSISGLVFVGTLLLVTNSTNIELELVILYTSAYVVAWLAGLVTPGAPAGVGVRELVLLFLLGAEVAQSDLLIAVILNRFITVTGDGSFFIWATLANWKKKWA